MGVGQGGGRGGRSGWLLVCGLMYFPHLLDDDQAAPLKVRAYILARTLPTNNNRNRPPHVCSIA